MSCWILCHLNIPARHSHFSNVALNVLIDQHSSSKYTFLMSCWMLCQPNIPARHSPFFQCRAECSARSTFQLDIHNFLISCWMTFQLNIPARHSPFFFFNVVLNVLLLKNYVRYISTVMFCYLDHSKLRPPSLLRAFVSVLKGIFQSKWIPLMRPVCH